MRDRGRRLTWADAAVAGALWIGYVLILVKSVGALGYARDEGFYFQASSSYGRWLEHLWSAPGAALGRKAVDAAWSNNHEHPALIKTLFALSNLLLQKRLGLFAMEGTSYRFPAMVLGGGLLALVYAWGTEARGRAAGLVGAAALAAMPRFFYHAHLACFDVPIVALWTLCAYTFWKAVSPRPPPPGAGAAGRASEGKPARSGERASEGRMTGWGWPLLAGLTFGLALDTKHNSWFLPIVAVTHTATVLVASRVLAGGASPLREAARAHARRAGRALVAMAVIGPAVFVALWPWIWHDTLPRLREYALFHLEHEYYNMEFLGVNYWTPPMPRGYAFLMTAATVPLVTLALFAAGLAGRARLRIAEGAFLLAERARERRASGAAPEAAGEKAPERGIPEHGTPEHGIPGAETPGHGAPRPEAPWLERLGKRLGARRTGSAVARRGPGPSAELLWLLSIGAIYAAWLSSKTPIFGGTKHWMTAYPFVALFAGVGFDDVVRAARAALLRWRRRVPRGLARAARGGIGPAMVLGAAVLAAPVVETARSHPWGLSSYTPLVGGAAGAATLGLNRTFWGYTTGAVAGYLNSAPHGASVFVHDTAGSAWDMLVTDGRIRRDLRGVGSIDASTLALYHHEKHMLGVEYQTWIAYGTVCPAHVAGLDGVPVIWVYRRPGN